MHNGCTTQAVEAIKVGQFGASNVNRQDSAGFHGKRLWAMTTSEHLPRSHATEAIDTAGRTRHGLTSGPCSIGEFAKQRVDRIPAFGVALYPIFVVLFRQRFHCLVITSSDRLVPCFPTTGIR